MNLPMISGPGKFGGEPELTRVYWEASLEGCADDEAPLGDGQGCFVLYRFKADEQFDFENYRANEAELAFLRTQAGVVLFERSDGFVSGLWADDAETLESEWREIESDIASD